MTEVAKQFPHYHKFVPTHNVDVYRVLQAFGVTDPCLQHAIKKLLVCGQRGSKDFAKDVADAISTLTRLQEMRAEEQVYFDELHAKRVEAAQAENERQLLAIAKTKVCKGHRK